MKSWSESFKRRAERRRRMARAAAQLDLIFEDHFTKLADPPTALNWHHGIWRGDERGMYLVPARRHGKSQFVPALHFAFRDLDPGKQP